MLNRRRVFTDRWAVLSVGGMLRGLWLVVAIAGGGCSRAAPRPAVAPEDDTPVAFTPVERDSQVDATNKLIAELSKKQREQKERADSARAIADHESERSEEEWLAVARDACRPAHCDGSPVRPSCAGVYDIPTWARVQAATEACAHPPPPRDPKSKEGNQVLSDEDWAAWRKRVTGK